MTIRRRRGLRLVYATIGWNAIEGVGALFAGIVANSVALTAFGLDSSVEVFVSLIAARQLRAKDDRGAPAALRLIGFCFVLVGVYVGIQAGMRLARRAHPRGSPVGIALTAVATIAMSCLGIAKRKTAARISSPVLAADATFSLVDAALSATVLVGLVSNVVMGWWWADPTVAAGLALLALAEGIKGILGSHRSDPYRSGGGTMTTGTLA